MPPHLHWEGNDENDRTVTSLPHDFAYHAGSFGTVAPTSSLLAYRTDKQFVFAQAGQTYQVEIHFEDAQALESNVLH